MSHKGFYRKHIVNPWAGGDGSWVRTCLPAKSREARLRSPRIQAEDGLLSKELSGIFGKDCYWVDSERRGSERESGACLTKLDFFFFFFGGVKMLLAAAQSRMCSATLVRDRVLIGLHGK